jgi:hypothetical protein
MNKRGEKSAAVSDSGTSASAGKQPELKPPSMQDLINEIDSKYKSKSWVTILPKSGPNDIVAQKVSAGKLRSKYHFVQLAPGRDVNNFIQNAFSNGATPVLASVKISKRDNEYKYTVGFTDANTKNKIII